MRSATRSAAGLQRVDDGRRPGRGRCRRTTPRPGRGSPSRPSGRGRRPPPGAGRGSSPGRARVESAGRLVGEDHRGPRDQRPGDRDALLLAARELSRACAARAPRAPPSRAPRRRGRAPACTPRAARAGPCSAAVERRDQVEGLEHEPDASRAATGSGRPRRGPRGRPRRAGPPRCRAGRARRRMCRNVLLPEPDGPITALKEPLPRQRKRHVRPERSRRCRRCP